MDGSSVWSSLKTEALAVANRSECVENASEPGSLHRPVRAIDAGTLRHPIDLRQLPDEFQFLHVIAALLRIDREHPQSFQARGILALQLLLDRPHGVSIRAVAWPAFQQHGQQLLLVRREALAGGQLAVDPLPVDSVKAMPKRAFGI
jgi:hypothetical protein